MKKLVLLFGAFLSLCASSLAQTDTIAPTLSCKNNLDITLGFLCTTEVFVIDLVDNLADNAGLQGLELGVRRPCTGSGFPASVSVNFDANDMGDTKVEVWARDAAGNTASCMANLTVYDLTSSCDPAGGPYAMVNTPADTGVAGVGIAIHGYYCLSDSFHCIGQYQMIQPGFYAVTCDLRYGMGYSVVPSKSANPLNGISTSDLVLIAKHLLGIQPFTTPWQYIAADASGDGKVSTYDIVVLRQLLLGIDTQLPGGKSWRFVPDMYVFPDPADPFNPPFPQQIDIDNTSYPPGVYSFRGVKIGDVNFSADPGQ